MWATKSRKKNIGHLSTHVVSACTLNRYKIACQKFFAFVAEFNAAWPSSPEEFDLLICRYIEHVWQEGEPRGWAGDAISGLGHFVPHVRKKLSCSWRLLTAWQKLELPARAIPLLPRLAAAIAGAVVQKGLYGTALAILVGFHCMLRTWGDPQYLEE